MLRWLDKVIASCFYLLFALVPLVMTPFNYELFEFNKMLLVYALTVIIAAGWLIKMIVSRRLLFQRTPLDLPILLFLIFNFLSFIFSIDKHTSLFGYYSRFNGGLLSIICYSLLYWAFVSNFSSLAVQRLIKTMLFTGGLVAAYGILEHFGIDANFWVQDVQNRVFSTLGQPNWLAAYLVALIPLTWARRSSFLFSLFYLCLLYTKSRSGLLGFGVAYLVFWGLAFLKQKKSILKSFLLFTFVILLLTLLARPSELSWATDTEPEILITPSSEIRKIVWQGAIKIWQNHPLLGTGPETFAYSYYWYRPREHNDTSEWDFLYNKSHNEYLNYLATTGIFGLGSYLLIIAFFVIFNYQFSIFNEFSIFNLALFAGWLGILVAQFFGFSVVITNLFFFLFPAMSFVLHNPHDKKTHTRNFVRLNWQQYSAIAIVLFFIFYFLFFILRLWYSDYLFAQGRKQLQLEAPIEAMALFQKAVALNPGEPLFRNELAIAASQAALAAPELAEFAIQQSDQALKISPYHLNYWKSRVKMFYYLGQVDKKYYQQALESLLKAHEMAPTDAKITYNLATLYDYLDEKEKAISAMQEAVTLKPNYTLAQQRLEQWQGEK